MKRYDSISYDFEVTQIQQPSEPIAYTTENKEDDNCVQFEGNVENVTQTDFAVSRLNKHTVLLFQLALCIIIAAAAFVIKSLGGEVYEKVKMQYQALLCDTLITDQNNIANESFIDEAVNGTENWQSVH